MANLAIKQPNGTTTKILSLTRSTDAVILIAGPHESFVISADLAAEIADLHNQIKETNAARAKAGK